MAGKCDNKDILSFDLRYWGATIQTPGGGGRAVGFLKYIISGGLCVK